MTDAPPGAHVVLLGPMGAGKTTTARALATRLGRPLLDSDASIEAGWGQTGASLAAREGVAWLHALEAGVLLEALASPEPAVVAAAASVVDSAECRVALQRASLVVWLDVPAVELSRRVAGGSHRRSLRPGEAEQVAARRRWFAEVSDLRLDGRQPTPALVGAVLDVLERS